MATLTDAALVERILDGDAEALAVLYDRFADRIHTMCAHLLHDRDEAADVTAEVLLTAVERIGQLRDPDKLRPWLYAIARNEVYRRTRHRRRVTPMADPDAGAAHGAGVQPAGLDLRGHLVDDPEGFDHAVAARLDGDAD
jgi:DNA-directed RNA polymerase specialized sigma24 family protein